MEGDAGVRGGRRATRACLIDQVGRWGRFLRARAGEQVRVARTSDKILATLPRRENTMKMVLSLLMKYPRSMRVR